MKKKTAIWIKIIVLGILTLALIGILIVGILGNTFRNFPIFGSFSSYDNADLYQVGNADISASELSSLSIDWVSGSVKVDVYDGNVIQIREDGASDLSDSDKAHYYYHDGTLDVRYRESGSFFSFFHSLGRKNLEILIPRSLASNLSEISGDVVSADTTINGLSTKDFYLDTVSGNLTFNGSAERINSDSVSGNCHITSSVTPQKIDMESVSGDISVSIPRACNRLVSVEYHSARRASSIHNGSPPPEKLRNPMPPPSAKSITVRSVRAKSVSGTRMPVLRTMQYGHFQWQPKFVMTLYGFLSGIEFSFPTAIQHLQCAHMVGLSEKAGRGFFNDGHHNSHVDAYRPTGSYDDGSVHDGAVVESGDDALSFKFGCCGVPPVHGIVDDAFAAHQPNTHNVSLPSPKSIPETSAMSSRTKIPDATHQPAHSRTVGVTTLRISATTCLTKRMTPRNL